MGNPARASGPDRTRVAFCGVDFDLQTMSDMRNWLAERRPDSPFAYIVTPNVDHVVRLSETKLAELRAAYRDADLCVCDSRILALLAKARGIELTTVPGSDLTANLLQDLSPGTLLAVIGGDAETCAHLQPHLPAGVELIQHIPPMGLMRNEAALDACVDFAVSSGARFTMLAVGSPQQEIIARRVAHRTGATGTALCIGASIDFLTGKAERAPRWMQLLALEWLHRLLSEPRRMWRRYLVDGPRVFGLAMRRGSRG